MKFTPAALLPLVGLASAIDVYFHQDYDCVGSYEVYSGANPGQCIDATRGASGVAFMGIPQDWNVDVETYRNLGCSSTGGLRDKSENSGNRNYVCLGADEVDVNSAVYNFVGAENVRRDDKSHKREGCGKPAEWVTKDGVHFRTSELTQKEREELMDLTADGTKGVELPELYLSIRQ